MSFNHSTEIAKCRKPHRCHWCGERIEIGQPAVRIVGIWEGDFGHCHWHPECNTVCMNMDWKEREAFGVDDAFDAGLFKRGTKELR